MALYASIRRCRTNRQVRDLRRLSWHHLHRTTERSKQRTAMRRQAFGAMVVIQCRLLWTKVSDALDRRTWMDHQVSRGRRPTRYHQH